MKLRVVIDTNIWIRILLRGRVTLPVLEAFNQINRTVLESAFRSGLVDFEDAVQIFSAVDH